MICDLCGQTKQCRRKEIEGREYNICSKCWSPLAQKLKGKGRIARERETVFLPPITMAPEPKEAKPLPGGPPKIWSRAGTPR
jgi:hypothetical protein